MALGALAAASAITIKNNCRQAIRIRNIKCMSQLPLRKRHYPKVEELVEEPGPHLLDVIMQKRALATLFYTGYPGALPSPLSAVSSAHGAITQLLLTVPYYVYNSILWKIYEQLIERLPSYTRFFILAHESIAAMLIEKLEELNVMERSEVRLVPNRINFTPWTEDPFIVVNDDKGPLLVEPHSFHRRNDSLIPIFMDGINGSRRLRSPLYFEGGNTIVGDDFILMGADYAVESLAHLGNYTADDGISRVEKVMKMYNDYLDTRRKIFYIGSNIPVPEEASGLFSYKGGLRKEKYYRQNKPGSVQPVFHIDMFITPAGRGKDGRYRLVVGDPALASEILGEKVSPYSIPEVFNDIANGLRANGFDVYRNPLPLVYMDDERSFVRNWYFASANNALVEITGNSKMIWLPCYGFGDWSYLHKTDEANITIWKNLGFEVIVIEDLHPLAEHSGSLHCIKKILRRD